MYGQSVVRVTGSVFFAARPVPDSICLRNVLRQRREYRTVRRVKTASMLMSSHTLSSQLVEQTASPRESGQCAQYAVQIESATRAHIAPRAHSRDFITETPTDGA